MAKEYFSTITGEKLAPGSVELKEAMTAPFNDDEGLIFEKGYRVKIDSNTGGTEIVGKRLDGQQDRMVLGVRLEGFKNLSNDEPPNAGPEQESERKKVLRAAFKETASNLKPNIKGGATAILTVTQGNYIYTVGVGDAVAYKIVRKKSTGEVISCKRLNRQLHKPTDESEQFRIQQEGGNVIDGRVQEKNGPKGVAVSRAFGDRDYPGVSSEPGEIYCDTILDDPVNVDPDIEVITIVSCDGLTEPAERKVNDKSNVDLVDLSDNKYQKFEHRDEKYIVKLFTESEVVKELAKSDRDISKVSQLVVKQALHDGSGDNISLGISVVEPLAVLLQEDGEAKMVGDGHDGPDVAEALTDEKTGLLHTLQTKIDERLNYPKTPAEIEKMRDDNGSGLFEELVNRAEKQENKTDSAKYFLARAYARSPSSKLKNFSIQLTTELAQKGHLYAKFDMARYHAEGRFLHGKELIKKDLKSAVKDFNEFLLLFKNKAGDQEFKSEVEKFLSSHPDVSEKLKDRKYIQNFKKSIKDSPEAAEKVVKDVGNTYTAYWQAQALFNQRNNPAFIKKAFVKENIYDIALADPEAARKIFLAKKYTVVPGTKEHPQVLTAKQIAELLQKHAQNPKFIKEVFRPLVGSNVDLVKLAKADVEAFKIIVNTPVLFKKMGHKQKAQVVEFYMAKPNKEALKVIASKPEFNKIASNDKYRSMATAKYYLSIFHSIQATSADFDEARRTKESMLSLKLLEEAAHSKGAPQQAKNDLIAYKRDLVQYHLDNTNFVAMAPDQRKTLIDRLGIAINEALKLLTPEQLETPLGKEIATLNEKVTAKAIAIEDNDENSLTHDYLWNKLK